MKKYVHDINAYKEPVAVLPLSTTGPDARHAPFVSVPSSSDSDSTLFSERIYFSSPLDSLIISSGYGYRLDPFTGKRKFHRGTDYLTHSENVYAIMPGKVKRIGYDRTLGNYITIEHGELTVTYAHLHTVVGDKGDIVRAGDSIGLSGSTGRSTGEHLHVSMKYKKDWIDPHPILCLIQRFSKGLFLPPSE